MRDSLTPVYVSDIIDAPNSERLSFATIRALEVVGHQSDILPSPAFSAWALASAAKARRLELSELWPGLFRPMVAMGAVVHGRSSDAVAQL